MSIIDWAALKRDGMPAFCSALLSLERACEFLTLRGDNLEQELSDALRQMAAMRLELTALRAEVAGERMARQELTHDTQQDLAILQTRIAARPNGHASAPAYVFTPGYPAED